MRAVRTWIAELEGHGITDGPVFRPIDRYGHIAGQPKQAGTPAIRLTGKSISDMIHRRALLARLPEPIWLHRPLTAIWRGHLRVPGRRAGRRDRRARPVVS